MTNLRSRYRRAEALLPANVGALVYRARVRPNWLSDHEFWYQVRTREGIRYHRVDLRSGLNAPAFDHVELARALGAAAGARPDPNALGLSRLVFTPGGVEFHALGAAWHCDTTTYRCRRLPRRPPSLDESVAPGGRWAVRLRDHNLVLRDLDGVEADRELTTDGTPELGYGTSPDPMALRSLLDHIGVTPPPAVLWSADGTAFATHRVDQRGVARAALVQSTPPDGSRPRLRTFAYSTVGEERLPTSTPLVYHLDTGTWVECKDDPLVTPFEPALAFGRTRWSADGRALLWHAGDRGDRRVRLMRMDAATGEVEELLEERSETQVQTHPIRYRSPNLLELSSGEILWWSQRDDWGHVYLRTVDGALRQVTHGPWLVRETLAVDETRRELYFTASGREADLDPYVRQIYRVGLDDGRIGRLTDDDLDHDVVASPAGTYLLDVASGLDRPAVSRVLDRSGEVVVELETADAADLYRAGWRPPERFRVKAADGTTDIHGVLYLPHGFDPGARYPVLDNFYPGPQVTAAPVRFPLSGEIVPTVEAAAMAALGFVTVVVDGRGTPYRSKSFQEHQRFDPDRTAFIDDHAAAIEQLAATRPWMDLGRVGAFGTSGGGYAAARALLHRPDFFTVAVATAGDHDDLVYQPAWGEKFFGLPWETDYRAKSNSALAARLEGRLLLIHGELDDNVLPSQTLRFAEALIRANRDFDLLLVPGADHTMAVHGAYTTRRRWDYLVRHLMGAEPPPYEIAEFPLDLGAIAEILGG
ncbi:S9 family peptidase [Rhizohabitans arisaemae]|uniref:S9 family peptidase n=1 Tax=Rhizohabitans arisaemae TaxID=2720610 RepID=UPI0024B17BB4|nr:DPP IV N-terminal domain-containing protein [Rhizohabitans arisaemae]